MPSTSQGGEPEVGARAALPDEAVPTHAVGSEATAAVTTAPPNWTALLAAAAATPEVAIQAETFIKGWQSASKPVALKCADGNTYVVKGTNAGRQAINDRIAAKLATLVGAPVPPSALIAIPEELRTATPENGTLGIGRRSRLSRHGRLH